MPHCPASRRGNATLLGGLDGNTVRTYVRYAPRPALPPWGSGRQCRAGRANRSVSSPGCPVLRGDSMPAFLARHYDVPTEVERRDDAPASFVWRGRRHVVREVLGHWWQTGPWGERLDGGVDDDEREVWRVEAAGRWALAGGGRAELRVVDRDL